MNEKRAVLNHLLAALAYRTQKALRDAPSGFGSFEAGEQVRTPIELVRHMTSVLAFTNARFEGGTHTVEPLHDLAAEVARFHRVLQELSVHLASDTVLQDLTEEQLLQGPLSDAITHAGQLALLRRLAGAPVRPESFVKAAIDPANVGPNQPQPASPAAVWAEEPKPVRSFGRRFMSDVRLLEFRWALERDFASSPR